VLADCDTLGGLEITDTLEESDHKLLHDSIGGFKGLERDVVIFADVDPEHPRCSPEARYVAASRARNRLYVFEKSDWQGDV
jgi:DNA helicase IV